MQHANHLPANTVIQHQTIELPRVQLENAVVPHIKDLEIGGYIRSRHGFSLFQVRRSEPLFQALWARSGLRVVSKSSMNKPSRSPISPLHSERPIDQRDKPSFGSMKDSTAPAPVSPQSQAAHKRHSIVLGLEKIAVKAPALLDMHASHAEKMLESGILLVPIDAASMLSEPGEMRFPLVHMGTDYVVTITRTNPHGDDTASHGNDKPYAPSESTAKVRGMRSRLKNDSKPYAPIDYEYVDTKVAAGSTVLECWDEYWIKNADQHPFGRTSFFNKVGAWMKAKAQTISPVRHPDRPFNCGVLPQSTAPHLT